MSDGTRRMAIGTALSFVGSWFGGYLSASPTAALCLLALSLAAVAGGSYAISRYQSSGQRKSRPVPLGGRHGRRS